MSVPKLDQGKKEVVAGRRERFTWTIRLVDEDGARCGLGASDVVRFKLATTEGGTPVLDISSSSPGLESSEATGREE